jgi:hypothetical protein
MAFEHGVGADARTRWERNRFTRFEPSNGDCDIIGARWLSRDGVELENRFGHSAE